MNFSKPCFYSLLGAYTILQVCCPASDASHAVENTPHPKEECSQQDSNSIENILKIINEEKEKEQNQTASVLPQDFLRGSVFSNPPPQFPHFPSLSLSIKNTTKNPKDWKSSTNKIPSSTPKITAFFKTAPKNKESLLGGTEPFLEKIEKNLKTEHSEFRKTVVSTTQYPYESKFDALPYPSPEDQVFIDVGKIISVDLSKSKNKFRPYFHGVYFGKSHNINLPKENKNIFNLINNIRYVYDIEDKKNIASASLSFVFEKEHFHEYFFPHFFISGLQSYNIESILNKTKEDFSVFTQLKGFETQALKTKQKIDFIEKNKYNIPNIYSNVSNKNFHSFMKAISLPIFKEKNLEKLFLAEEANYHNDHTENSIVICSINQDRILDSIKDIEKNSKIKSLRLNIFSEKEICSYCSVWLYAYFHPRSEFNKILKKTLEQHPIILDNNFSVSVYAQSIYPSNHPFKDKKIEFFYEEE